MLKNLLLQQLLKNLVFEPTGSQRELLTALAGYISANPELEIFVIKGFAGTGKTTLVNSLVKTLHSTGMKTVLMAPTGRAAKVLTSYTGHTAYTIHKKIYRQKKGRDGLGEFVLDRNIHKSTWFIVDEASMIADRSNETRVFGSGDLLYDLTSYVQSGSKCRLVLLGDTAQLPPVNLEISPALERNQLERLGLRVNEFFLTDVIRQAMESGILHNATLIRQKIDNNASGFPCLEPGNFTDIKRINGGEVLEEIESCYNNFGLENTIVVCRTNKRANRFNEGIRNRILWREEELSQGDLLMVVKNNYFWTDHEKSIEFIANGDIARINRISKYSDYYGYRFAHVNIELIDYNVDMDTIILLDTLSLESASLSIDSQRDLFAKVMEDYEDESDKKVRIQKTRENPYFNALQVKFAYAVTCHKAQGGQWKAVFVDIGYFNDDMLSTEYLRWLYTAFTRAVEKLYLINFPDSFFD